MKKLMIFTFASVLFASCNFALPVRYASSSPEIDALKSSIKHYLAQNWNSSAIALALAKLEAPTQ